MFNRVKVVVAQIILAFSFLHAHNIVYQDLKPENILIEEDGYIKLTDFGASKFEDKINNNYTNFIGTVEYVAPEILQRKKYNGSLDIWCLGILTYELIYKSTPFEGNSINEIFKNILGSKLKFNKKINFSEEGKSFITKCLIRDPAIRYKSGRIDDLKNDDWFSDISFTDLYNKNIDLEDKLNVDYNYVFTGKDNSNKNTAINEETYVGKTTRSLIDEFNNNFSYFND